MISPDDILNERLGPSPIDLLQSIITLYPNLAAVSLVLETYDGEIQVLSGGCTMIETVGMLQYGASAVVTAVRGPRQDNNHANG
jgi:hypothetical protein